jgi:hypothetical protein
VEFGFRHRPLQAEQEPVVEVARVIQAVLVENEGAGQCADLQQPVPVGVVAGQPGDLQAEHDPGPAHGHLGDEALETIAIGGGGAGLALVGVNDHDLLGGPAQRDGPTAQVVLAVGGLGVGQYLPQRGLTHIQVGVAAQVFGGDLHRRLRPEAVHGAVFLFCQR